MFWCSLKMEPTIVVILAILATTNAASTPPNVTALLNALDGPCAPESPDITADAILDVCRIGPATNTKCSSLDPIAVIRNIVVFNRNEKNITIPIWPTVSSQFDQFFNTSCDTIFIIHGWLGSGYDSWITQMALAYLGRDFFNIIAVNWSGGAKQNYPQAVADIVPVAEVLCQLSNYIYGLGYGSEKIHVVGHSLGGQTAGLYAKTQKKNGKIIGSVIALDPAGPNFTEISSSQRVAPKDAKSVIVLHCNTGLYGYAQPCGDADVYVDGGVIVAKCLAAKDAAAQNLISELAGVYGCSHNACHDIWTSYVQNENCGLAQKVGLGSILSAPENVLAADNNVSYTPRVTSCSPKNCFPVGYKSATLNLKGLYILTTSIEPPYCNSG